MHTVQTVYQVKLSTGFPLYFGSEIQGLFKDPKVAFQGLIFDEAYSMDSITAIFNIYFFDYGTVLVDKNKT